MNASDEHFVIVYHPRNADAALMAEAELLAWGVNVERIEDRFIPEDRSYVIKLPNDRVIFDP